MTQAAHLALSRSTADERGTFAILAAIKPSDATDANDAVLRTAQWLAEHEHRELHAVSVIETAPFISAFAAGVPSSLRSMTKSGGGRSSTGYARRTNAPAIPPRASASTSWRGPPQPRSATSRANRTSAWWSWAEGRTGR